MKEEKWKKIFTNLLTIFFIFLIFGHFQKNGFSLPSPFARLIGSGAQLNGEDITAGKIERYVDNESGVVCYLYTNINTGNSMVCLQPN